MSSKVMRRQLNLRARIIIIAILIISIAVIVLTIANNSISPVQISVVDISGKDSYSFSNSGLVTIEGKILSFDDLANGKGNWSLELLDNNFKVASSDSIIAIYNDRVVQGYDYSGNPLYQMIEYSSTSIDSVRCGTNYISVLRKSPADEYSVSLIDRTGRELDPLEISNAVVLNYDYYGTDQLWILTVNTDAGTVASTITTYSGGDAITGVMNIEGEQIEKVYPLSSQFHVAGVNSLHSFSINGKEEAKRQIYGWEILDISHSESTTRFLAVPRSSKLSNDSSPAKLFSVPIGAVESDLRLPPNCITAFISNNRVTAVTSNVVYVYNDDGTIYKQYNIDFVASSATKLKTGKVLLQNADKSALLTVDVR